jgi:CPA2 family monovalent cation:H+ antiporter-2
VVLVRVLSDNGALHTRIGHIAVGWLVVEDLFTILALVLLPLVFGSREGDPRGIAVEVGFALLKISVLIGFIVVVGGRVLPWLLARVAATRSRELFTLTILVVALGISIGAAKVFGASMALGAFLAGMVVGRSEFSLRAASEALPMRDAFAVLFFVSVGMLFNPAFVLDSPLVVILTLLVVMIGKPAAAVAITLARGYSLKIALAVAAALAQIGEFSFILAALAIQLGVLPQAALDTLVAVAIVSISANPLIYRAVGPVERWLRRKERLPGAVNGNGTARDRALPDSQADTFDPEHRAVIVGYGPVGQTLARILAEQGIEPVIIEMNLGTVQKLRAEGTKAHYGDATLRTTLETAGVATARTFVLSVSALRDAEEMIRIVRDLNPDIRVLARATYVSEKEALKRVGADKVFSGEGEVALSMAVNVLEELGATPEQVDRERSRVHQDIL